MVRCLSVCLSVRLYQHEPIAADFAAVGWQGGVGERSVDSSGHAAGRRSAANVSSVMLIPEARASTQTCLFCCLQ